MCNPVSIRMSTELIKSLVEVIRTNHNLLLASSMMVISTIFVSVAVSYHLAMAGIKSVSDVHQESLEESHRFINRTIDSVVNSLRVDQQNLLTDLSDLRSTSANLRIEIQLAVASANNIRDKLVDTKKEATDARLALKTTLTEEINRINNDLSNKLNDLRVNLNLKIVNIMKEANVTEEDIESLMVKVNDQRISIDEIDSKTGDNTNQLETLKNKSETDRGKIRNVTKMYTKIVLLTKSYLTNTTADPTKIKEIMTSLEKTMKILQDSKIKEAIEGFNNTIQNTILNHSTKYSADISSLKKSMRMITEGMKEYLYRSLGYVLIPNAGYYLISSSREMSFRTARDFCKEKSGFLVEFENGTEEGFLLEYLRDTFDDPFSFWIGLRDHAEENSFKWESSGKQANYTKWYDGEPNNAQSGEDCVESTNFNKWNDIDCGDTRKFICEFDENLSFTNMTDLM